MTSILESLPSWFALGAGGGGGFFVSAPTMIGVESHRIDCNPSRLSSGVLTGEESEMLVTDGSAPSLVLTMPRNSHNAGCISDWHFGILPILRSRYYSEIFPSIIRSISIYMVDLIRRIFSGYHFPDNSMGAISNPIKLPLFVAISLANIRKCWLACMLLSPTLRAVRVPKEFASCGVIRKALAEIFSVGQGCKSHSAVLSRGGQGRALCNQRFRPVMSSPDALLGQGA